MQKPETYKEGYLIFVIIGNYGFMSQNPFIQRVLEKQSTENEPRLVGLDK